MITLLAFFVFSFIAPYASSHSITANVIYCDTRQGIFSTCPRDMHCESMPNPPRGEPWKGTCELHMTVPAKDNINVSAVPANVVVGVRGVGNFTLLFKGNEVLINGAPDVEFGKINNLVNLLFNDITYRYEKAVGSNDQTGCIAGCSVAGTACLAGCFFCAECCAPGVCSSNYSMYCRVQIIGVYRLPWIFLKTESGILRTIPQGNIDEVRPCPRQPDRLGSAG